MENQSSIIFGVPGSGKSNYQKRLALEDIERGDRCVVYIEPHGLDSIDLMNQIPRNRIRDVCYLDASDPDYAVGFQPLTAPHRLVSAMRMIFKDSWGPRLEQFLRNGLAAIQEADLTLQDLAPLYYDKAHRAKVLSKVTRPSTRAFWFDLYPKAFNVRQQQEAALPIFNKLDAILASDVARHLIQRKPKLDFKRLIETQGILVVNLASPIVGEDSALILGSLLTTAFRNALMENPGPASFFADEFQLYGTDVYLSMLRELRKFGLKLCMATQTSAGIDETFLKIILGTVRDQIVFRVAHDDAEMLSAKFNTPIYNLAANIADLPPYVAYVNERRTEMPAFRSDRKSLEKIHSQSRQRYAFRF